MSGSSVGAQRSHRPNPLHGSSQRAWTQAQFDQLVLAARDKTRVSGLTHNFYRYPARFSPTFVRAAIEMFTEPGDLVFDPFMGGGTTLVEAISLGRNAVGSDISSLATFVSEAKTLLLSDRERQIVDQWSKDLSHRINIHRAVSSRAFPHAGDDRHIRSVPTWRLRKATQQALACAESLPSATLEKFARCVVLRTAQWALDGRKQLPTVEEFREAIQSNAEEMLQGAEELRVAVARHAPLKPTVTCINQTIVGLEAHDPCRGKAPRLVLTSPPYPGVHVLYHRWQVDGRKETAAPFWIANKLDGSGGAYYTLGGRGAKDNWTYFEGLEAALRSVASICDDRTTIVQVVAFADPVRQLPRYVQVAESAGLREIRTPAVSGGGSDGRLWRVIPNRKWHADQMGSIPASQEVVLFHQRD